MIMNFGMSQYEAAKSATKDEFKRQQGIEDDSVMKALGVFFIGIVFILLILGCYFCMRSCKGTGKCGQLGAKLRTMLR